MAKPTNIILIGGQDRGKSRKAKELLKLSSLQKIVYDVNGEYSGKKFTGIMEDFISNVKNLENKQIVFEEASIFFSSRGREEDIISMLVKHNGNIHIFCFHSLIEVPTYIVNKCHFLILFKTKDNPASVERKFRDYPVIFNAYKKVMKSKKSVCDCKSEKIHDKGFHDYEIINIEP